MSEENKMEKKIDTIEENVKSNKIKNNLIIIFIIILIFLLCLLGYKMSKVGNPMQTSGPINEDLEVIEVSTENLNLDINTELSIFNNNKFGMEKKIAPHSMGMYQFIVKNETENDVMYNIRILDEMSNFVNMKYKLKLNNVYICGSADTYVLIKDLNVDDIILLDKSKAVYTLEWYWEDDDEKDTYIGNLTTDEYYTLRLNILAQKIEN